MERISDLERLATDLADFLAALYAIDPTGGPVAGAHSFFRGGALTTYDRETREALSILDPEIDTEAACEVWDPALAAPWHGPAVWVHGDVTASNLLVVDERLSAVIDFGCSAVGDPACDLTMAWTFFHGGSRDAFRSRLALDDATWARGRGWALWKALITLVDALRTGRAEEDRAARRFGWRVNASRVVEEVLADASKRRAHEHIRRPP